MRLCGIQISSFLTLLITAKRLETFTGVAAISELNSLAVDVGVSSAFCFFSLLSYCSDLAAILCYTRRLNQLTLHTRHLVIPMLIHTFKLTLKVSLARIGQESYNNPILMGHKTFKTSKHSIFKYIYIY